MHATIVHKYGGTSVADAQCLRGVAAKVASCHRLGQRVVVVVSAMGGTTGQLVDLARSVSHDPDRRELDVLLASGEQASMSLLAMALRDLGVDAVSLTGAQCGILTNAVHGNARIVEIRPGRVLEELDRGQVVVVAGFQGAGPTGEVTTLGRGGSDTTAVALAAALDAEYCDIFTDVEGVWSADPRLVESSRPLDRLHADEMEALGWHGARVLKAEAVEFARDNGVTIRVGSTFGGDHATEVSVGDTAGAWQPERPAVVGVAGRKDLVRLALDLDPPGELGPLAETVAGYDLIFSNLDPRGRSELYLSSEEMPDLEAFRTALAERFGGSVETSDALGAISLVGFGIGSRPADLIEAWRTVRRHDLSVIESFTDRETLSFIVPVERVDEGVRLLHRTFVEGVDATSAPVTLATAH